VPAPVGTGRHGPAISDILSGTEMRLVAVTVVVVAICTVADSLIAQGREIPPRPNLRSKSWTEENGLPGSGVWSITQDAEGYLWLGTNAGLVRFDGVRFVHWNPSDNSFPESAVTAVAPASDGGLWIGFGGTGGVGYLGPDGFSLVASVSDRPIGTVAALTENPDGTLWVAGSHGVVTRRDGRWHRHGGELANSAYAFVAQPHGAMLVATARGLVEATGTGNGLLTQRVMGGLRGLAADPDGRIWMTNPSSVLTRLRPTPSKTAAIVPSGGVSLLRDRKGNLWAATAGDGVWLGMAGPGPEQALQRLPTSQIVHQTVRALFEDREGNIWVGTQHGLTRLSWETLTWVPPWLGEHDQPLRAVTADARALWVGGRRSAWRMSISDGEVREIPFPEGVTALHTTHDGTTWLGTSTGRLVEVRDSGIRGVALPDIAGRAVTAITSDKTGALWLSDLVTGVYRYFRGTAVQMNLRADTDLEAAITLYTDRQERVWIGYTDGVLGMVDGSRFVTYSDQPAAGRAVPGRVYSVYEDSRGHIWIGTNAGLRLLSNQTLVPVSLDYRRAGSYVVAVTEDQEGNLWVGCSQGVVRIARDDLDAIVANPGLPVKHRLYDASNGLAGRPAWLQGAPAVGRVGQLLWFVTSNGIAALDSTRWDQSQEPPAAHIEGIVADGEVVSTRTPGVLRPHTGRVQFDYTALSQVSPERIQFRYQLAGYDSDWFDAGVRRQAFYTNLPPGDYEFKVQSGRDDRWNPSTTAWKFRIEPDFYQTNGFRIFIGLAVLVLVSAAVSFRSRQSAARFQLILAERARVSREIHDTLLQTLIGITLQFDDLEHRVLTDESSRSAVHAMRVRLTNGIRDARHSIRNLRAQMPQRKLVPALSHITEELRRDRSVNVSLDIHGVAFPMAEPDEEELIRIVNEALTNAVRHSQASTLNVDVSFLADAIEIAIVDDGRGFDPHTTELMVHDHWGLASMQERAEQIGAEFRLDSQPGKGTRIHVRLPRAPIPPRERNR
jgi:signal transduction histidine kinase/ligand-binding sensor domain-containing protein